ncbi:MAG TPA: response regulator transcription factor [Anaerolineales bacterium]|nr:response regulator transcription factor [Anaerolineales bacterium]
MPTVLIVDDDPRLLKMLQRTLSYEGMRVITAANGVQALEQVDAHHPQVIILDWMMPRMDGLSVLQQLRADNDRTHVLMLTARDALDNRVEGLESGADDYLVKPFAPSELVARVHAMLRRVEGAKSGQAQGFADLSLDPQEHTVRRGEMPLELTPTEFELLAYFMRHPHQVLERGQILNSVWGYDFEGDDNVLEVYVGYLRKKLEAGGGKRLIHTVRGIGYVLREV